MSNSAKTKLLVIGLLAVLIASCSQAIAQTIKLDLHIKVDKAYKNNEQYNIRVLNLSTNKTEYLLMDNKFDIQLEYNTKYQISVSGVNTNHKTICIDTNAPLDDWYIISGFDLTTSNDEYIIAGGIKYDQKLRTFVPYKI